MRRALAVAGVLGAGAAIVLVLALVALGATRTPSFAWDRPADAEAGQALAPGAQFVGWDAWRTQAPIGMDDVIRIETTWPELPARIPGPGTLTNRNVIGAEP